MSLQERALARASALLSDALVVEGETPVPPFVLANAAVLDVLQAATAGCDRRVVQSLTATARTRLEAAQSVEGAGERRRALREAQQLLCVVDDTPTPSGPRQRELADGGRES